MATSFHEKQEASFSTTSALCPKKRSKSLQRAEYGVCVSTTMCCTSTINATGKSAVAKVQKNAAALLHALVPKPC